MLEKGKCVAAAVFELSGNKERRVRNILPRLWFDLHIQ